MVGIGTGLTLSRHGGDWTASAALCRLGIAVMNSTSPGRPPDRASAVSGDWATAILSETLPPSGMLAKRAREAHAVWVAALLLNDGILLPVTVGHRRFDIGRSWCRRLRSADTDALPQSPWKGT
jgi:hypothetical protein